MVLGRNEITRRIREGQLVSNLTDKTQIQQAGIDLTVGKVYELVGEGALDFDNSKRVICRYSEIEPQGSFWDLEPGVYHCAMNEWISIPPDLCGLLLPRSSALACGIHIHSALWDPGYNGRSFIHTHATRKVRIYRNARIAQMVFLRVFGETTSYTGAYLGEDVFTLGRRGIQKRLDQSHPKSRGKDFSERGASQGT